MSAAQESPGGVGDAQGESDFPGTPEAPACSPAPPSAAGYPSAEATSWFPDSAHAAAASTKATEAARRRPGLARNGPHPPVRYPRLGDTPGPVRLDPRGRFTRNPFAGSQEGVTAKVQTPDQSVEHLTSITSVSPMCTVSSSRMLVRQAAGHAGSKPFSGLDSLGHVQSKEYICKGRADGPRLAEVPLSGDCLVQARQRLRRRAPRSFGSRSGGFPGPCGCPSRCR